MMMKMMRNEGVYRSYLRYIDMKSSYPLSIFPLSYRGSHASLSVWCQSCRTISFAAKS